MQLSILPINIYRFDRAVHRQSDQLLGVLHGHGPTLQRPDEHDQRCNRGL